MSETHRTVSVTSEIGRLRRVLLHEPGAEVDRMVPAMMDELLFDDILDGERARDEHGQLRRVLGGLGVDVVEAGELLREALATDAARSWVAEVLFHDLLGSDRHELEGLSPEELTTLLVEGSPPRAAAAGVEVEDLYAIPPLPNWCFQRDPQMIVGQGVIFASMATRARHREGLLARVIFRHHPGMRSLPVLFDPLEAGLALPALVELERPSLEGGDLLVVSRDVVVVGLSERTNRAAVRRLARALSSRDGAPRWLVLVAIPRRRAYMHLDTLVTPVDHDACLVYAPVLLDGGPEQARVWEVDLHAADLTPAPRERLLACLAAKGLDLEPIPCGGDDPVSQQREQWTDGANALALAPGTIVLYERNRATIEQLDRRGFRIVTSEALLAGRAEVDLDAGRRTCILLASHEISRARGGPHCLVHPLLRDEP